MATSSGTAVVTLPTDEQILITREFEAPRHLVWEAWTNPELVKRWWHANRGEMTIAEIDLRVGGTWRWVMVTPDGFEVAFHGEYREIVPHERIVSTEVYEGFPEGEAREHPDAHRGGRAHDPHDPRPAREQGRTATGTSTPAWKPACRTRWTSWSRWRSRSASARSEAFPGAGQQSLRTPAIVRADG